MNAEELADRLLDFNEKIIKIWPSLQISYIGRHIFGQLFRASSSSGANYEEARGAESRADFLHKMQIVLKELRETAFWLKLLQRAKLLKEDEIDQLICEVEELKRIFSKAVMTSKSSKKI
jgi:four helix bundle protein